MVKFSLVVPIYNKEKYLKATLDSIVHIKNENFEVVLIDDGSTDQSSAICDNYSKQYTFVHTYHIENGGVTNARKYGVLKSHGEWISFVDADDTVTPNYLEVLSRGANNDCDIIVAGQDHNGFVDHKNALWLFIDGKLAAVHQKLYRKTLFSDYVFDIPRTITRGEDMIMNIRLAYASKKKVMFLEENVYNYEMRQDGLFLSIQQTINALELWYEYYMESLSVDVLKEHEYDFMIGKMSNLLEIALRNPFHVDWRNSKFYKDLKDNCNNILVPLKYKVLFVNNPCFLILSLILIKVYNRMK